MTTFVPGTDTRRSVTDYHPETGIEKMTVEYNPNTNQPISTTTFDPVTGLRDMHIKFKEDGVTVDKTDHYKDGKVIPK